MSQVQTWMTPPAIAEELAVNVDRVRGWIASGQLAAVNVGDGQRPRWRISQDAFDAFLLLRAAKTPQPVPPRRKVAVREYF